MAKYNLFQQTFTLSSFSNELTAIPGYPSYLEEKLTKKINNKFSSPDIQALIGDWKIAWGPVVFQAKGSLVADNTMYVAVNDENVYVVAIAGSNLLSAYDLVVEDLWISKTVTWQYSSVSSSNVLISQGVSIGISHLLAMTSQGQTLADFLTGISHKSEATIIFTGHSLGGALAPTLALALMSPDNIFELQKNDWRAVYVYPTAGFTPGSDGFADFFAEVFPIKNMGKEVWENWNSLIWNNLDFWPNVWNIKTLFKVPYLYIPFVLPDPFMASWIANAKIISKFSKANYTQLQSSNPLNGSINRRLIFTASFLLQAAYQHASAYYHLLDVTEIMPRNLSIIEKQTAQAFAHQLKRKWFFWWS